MFQFFFFNSEEGNFCSFFLYLIPYLKPVTQFLQFAFLSASICNTRFICKYLQYAFYLQVYGEFYSPDKPGLFLRFVKE